MIKVRTNLFRAAALCCSRDATRYYINGVHIEPHHDKGAVLVGTDGRRMLVAYDDEATCEKAVVVSGTLLKLAQRLWIDPNKLVPEDDEEWGEADERTTPPEHILIDSDGRLTIGEIKSTASALIDGTFPDWRKVVPEAAAEPSPLSGVDGRLLAEFASIADLLHPGTRCIALRPSKEGDGAPVFVMFPATPNAFGVLMPMKGKAAQAGLPPFMKPPIDKAA
jgi:hypothetical protein